MSHSHRAPGTLAMKKCSDELDVLTGLGHGAPGVWLDTVPGVRDVFPDQAVFQQAAGAQQRALPSAGGPHSPAGA